MSFGGSRILSQSLKNIPPSHSHSRVVLQATQTLESKVIYNMLELNKSLRVLPGENFSDRNVVHFKILHHFDLISVGKSQTG